METPMKTTIEMVREFSLAFGVVVKDSPTVPMEDTRRLRIELIAEELAELAAASGFEFDYKIKPGPPLLAPNLVAAADACGDLDYVVQGTFLAWGLPAHEIVSEIHRSNMSKLGPGGLPIYRSDGKVLKGPNYTPPNLSPILLEV